MPLGRCLSSGRLSILADAQQFDLVDDGLVGQRPAPAVGELGRQVELPPGAFTHQLQGLGPAADHFVHAKTGRAFAVIGVVEFVAVERLARYFNLTTSFGPGFWPLPDGIILY